MTEIHEQVRRVFNNLNTDHDELLSRDQILRFLDRTSQELYDRAIFEQLYVRIQKGNNGYICIKDFIKVLFDGLDSLRNKITKIEDELVEKKDSLQIISQKYQAIAKKERFNNQGISLESMVQVTILDAEILFPTGATLYWVVGLDKQKLQTTQATRESPVWNQALEFTVSTGQESLWLVLLDETSIQRDDLCGQAQVVISQFEDQKKHKLTLDLHDRANNLLNARVHLVVQWIHSQTKFIEEQIQEQQLQMQELNFDLDEYKKDLKAMFKPFQKTIATNRQPNALEHSFAQQTPELTIQRIHEPKNESEDFLNLAIVGTLLYLLVILLASLDRTLYLDMLVLFYIVFFFRNNSEIQSMLHIKIMAALLIATIVSDMIWLSIFTKHWIQKKVIGMDLEETMFQYEIIITFILDFIKVLILLVLLYIYRLNPEKRVDIQDEQYVKIFRPNEQVVKTETIPISPVTQSRYMSQPQAPYQVPTVRQYQTFQPYQQY